jgi:conjugal transfer pilus assembly protein TrbC
MTASLPRLGGGPAGLVDFDALVKTAADAGADHGRAPQLIVFASLAMPPQSLKALIRDTARAGGSVVFNGFPGNSMKAFQEGILKVVDNRDDYGSIGIDPRLFRAFHVSAVPAVVVVTSDFDLCDGLECTTQPPPFDRISGNVTLDYALDTIAAGDGPARRSPRRRWGVCGRDRVPDAPARP